MADKAFVTTHWSVVLEARGAGEPGAGAAWSSLCGTYWSPLNAYLRGAGHSEADANDLVQGFFERLLARDTLKDVAPEKGRFRSFLLAALRHQVLNHLRDGRAQRRGGGCQHIALDAGDAGELPGALGVEPDRGAELAYDREWARTVMEHAAGRLREEYRSGRREALYEGVRQWLAREALPGEYAGAAPGLGLTEGALAVAVHRLRQRFRVLIRAEVARTVRDEAEVDDEMRHLFRVLAGA